MTMLNRLIPDQAGYFAGRNVASLGRALRTGELTSVHLVGLALIAINELNPRLNAFVEVNQQGALNAAQQADIELAAGIDRGPLHGIPVGIKDNIFTMDMPTTMGSAHFREFRPEADALCVSRLRQAGAIILGKTLTHEFAYGPTADRALQGASVNPWGNGRMSGGSSGGSAVAVAAGMVPLAIGTDTGGSVRIPAALCGVVGFKPSQGVVDPQGVFPLSVTLDHVGCLAGTVGDATLLFDVIADRPTSAPHKPIDITGLRAAWVPAEPFSQGDPIVIETLNQYAQQRFAKPLPLATDVAALADELHLTLASIQRHEAWHVHAQRVVDAPHLFDPEVLDRLHVSSAITAHEYAIALEQRHALQHRFSEFFKVYEVLLMPAVAVVAPMLQQRVIMLGDRPLTSREALLGSTSPWNLLGFPAISVPAGMVEGLPIGLQMIAAPGRDAWLLEVAGRWVGGA